MFAILILFLCSNLIVSAANIAGCNSASTLAETTVSTIQTSITNYETSTIVTKKETTEINFTNERGSNLIIEPTTEHSTRMATTHISEPSKTTTASESSVKRTSTTKKTFSLPSVSSTTVEPTHGTTEGITIDLTIQPTEAPKIISIPETYSTLLPSSFTKSTIEIIESTKASYTHKETTKSPNLETTSAAGCYST